jgi:hypothetical protein
MLSLQEVIARIMSMLKDEHRLTYPPEHEPVVFPDQECSCAECVSKGENKGE